MFEGTKRFWEGLTTEYFDSRDIGIENAAQRSEELGKKIGAIGHFSGDPLGVAGKGIYNTASGTVSVAGKTGKAVGNAVNNVTIKPVRNVVGKAIGATKLVGFGAAALVGAAIISSMLGSKRKESADELANAPAQQPAPMDFASFGPTGSVQPVEGSFVEKYAKGGAMSRTAMPATPDVASRAEAVEQSRMGAAPTLSA